MWVIALIVLFQDEIRRFLLTLGSHRHVSALAHFFSGARKEALKHDDIMPVVMACLSMGKQKVGALIVIEHTTPLDEVVRTGEIIDAAISQRLLACMSMSKGKVGALIVIEKSMPLNDIIRTGEIINANVNQRLIENIFFKNSPLHDGAMIIRHKRIEAAGCILPVSHDLNIPKELGLRHRAAMGVSQETDALAIIVSEETGGISVAYKGQFHLRLTAEELERILTKEE